MAKQLNVDLNFKANTSTAKQQIQQLQQQLNSLSATSSPNLPITKEIQEARAAASSLQVALQQAVNVNTGKFDLSKFNSSLKSSGTNLEQVKNRLVALGPSGQQAFMSLAQSIVQAEIPMRRTSTLLSSIGATLKNTIKWQLSSSMIHGFVGAISTAYNYAQDLNESLNNIRIVTGQSTAQMEKFAIEANKAAKALSASTLEYTNASLIYYQQGLNADEVKERADVTIKLANVTGQSSKEVSDQLTGIWNNFNDGTSSLEYYADVLAKLGATTASSSTEISQGLEKFASVTNTVGLSYEYAAAALATVTATTRQSADVVGTAFKTLFARLQDLKLGETLDDGTTLGAYSANLAKVGVNIKDASGQLKDMDTILEETAERWKNLDRDQQVALAKGVAGIRQYNTFISLMDNWDFMEENIATAKAAGGTLQDQADIYAESWEGARKRVKNAAEAIYTDLLDDDFFIKISNRIADLLGFIDQFLDSIGGAKGLLLGLGSILLNTFGNSVTKSLENLVYNFKSFVGLTQKEAISLQSLAGSLVSGVAAQGVMDHGAAAAAGPGAGGAMIVSSEMDANLTSMQHQIQLNQELAGLKENMTEHQRKEAEAILQANQLYADQVRLLGQKADTAHAEKDQARSELFDNASFELGATATTEALDRIDDDIAFGDKIAEEVAQAQAAFRDTKDINAYKAKLNSIKEEIRVASDADAKAGGAKAGGYNEMYTAVDSAVGRVGKAGKEYDVASEVQVATAKTVQRRAQTHLTQKDTKGAKPAADTKEIDKYIAKTKAATKADKAYSAGKTNLSKTTKNASKQLKGLTNTTQSVTQGIVKGAQAATSLSFALMQIGSLSNIWSDDTLTGGQKLLQTFMSLGMAIPMFINGIQGMNAVLGVSTAIQGKKNALLGSYLALSSTELATMTAEQVAQATGMSLDEAEIALSKAKAGAKLAEVAASSTNLAEMTAEQLVQATGMTMDQAEMVLSKLKAGANLEEAASEAGLTTTKLSGVAAGIMSIYTKGLETGATWAQVVANWALQTSMSPVLIITLLLVAAIALLAVAIAGIVNLINKASDAYNADTIAAANAEAAAENLAQAYADVKAEYEDMIAAMEKYQTARAGLAELTEGTQEYQEALEAANQSALDLMQNYSEYFKDGDYEWQNGQLILNEAALERAKAVEWQQVQDAYAASTMANAGAKQARAVANQTDLKRDIRDDHGIGDGDLVWKGVGSVVAGSVVGGIIPVLGPVIASFIGDAVSGALIGGAKAGAYDDAIDKAMSIYENDNNLFSSYDYLAEKMEEVGVTNTDLITALWENRNSLNELGEEFAAAAMSMKVAAENVAQTIVSDNELVSQHEQSDEIAGALARNYQGNYELEQKEALEDIKSRGIFNTGTKEAKAIMDEYAKVTGLDKDFNYKVTNYVGDGTVKIEKTLDDGSVEEVTVTAEEIAAQVAASRAGAAAESAMEVIMSDFEHLKLLSEGVNGGNGNAAAGGMLDFLSDGNLKGATREELSALDSMIVKGDGTAKGDVLALQATAEQLDSMLAGEATDYGYATFAEMAKALQEEAEKTEEAWNNIDLPDDLKNVSELSLEAAQGVEKDIETIATGPNGENNVQAYTDFLNEVTSQMGDADAEHFMNQISDIDWSDWYAMDDVTALLNEIGYTLDTTTPEMQEFIEAMRLAGGASPAEMIQKTKDSIEALGSTLSEGIAPGSLLDEETYKKLIERNAELAASFQKTIDGSYQYVGGESLGIEQLGIDSALNEARQSRELYENAKESASDIDFLGMSTAKYTSAETLKTYEKNIEDKEEIIAAEKGKNWDLNIFSWTDQSAITSAAQAIEQNEQLIDQAKEQNAAIIKEMSESAEKVLNDESLMLVAKKIGYTAEEIADIRQSVLDGNEDSIEKMRVFSERFNAYMTAGDSGEYDTQEFEEMIASTAKSFEELDQLTQQYGLSVETYNKAWSGLNEAEKWEGIEAEDVQNYSKHLQNIAKDSQLVSSQLTSNAKAAETVARSTIKMNNGIAKLSDGIEEWSDVLKKSDKSSQEYSESINEMKNAMSDVIGVSEHFLTDDFILENLEDIEKAAEGNAEAIDRLAVAAGRSIIINLDMKNEGLESKVLDLHDDLAADLPDLEVGATLNDGDFLTKAKEIVKTAGMTVDEANAYFSAMGFEPEFVTEEKEVEQTSPITVTETRVRGYTQGTATMPDGSSRAWEQPILEQTTYQDGSVPTTGKMSVIAMSADGKTPKIKSLTRKSSGAMNNNSSQNAGSTSGGSSQKAKAPKKSDMVKRYKEVNDALDKLADTAEDTSKAMDRLYGTSRLKQMEQQNNLIQDEIQLLKQKKREALKYMEEDRKLLDAAAQEAGVTLELDENGFITNYESTMTALYDELDAAVNEANADGTVSDAEQEKIDKIQERADNLQEAMDQYDETRLEIQDLDNQLDEKFYEWQDNNAEILNYQLELKLEINDSKLDTLDYYLTKIEDDFYKMAEAAALMVDATQSMTGTSQLDIYKAKLTDYADQVTALNEAYNATDPSKSQISQAAYVDGLKEAKSGLIENLQSLQELDKSMMEYYGNTLDMAGEEIAKYTNRMDQQTSVLEHYSSLLSIMGKENDYKTMGKVLEGKAKIIGDQAAVSKRTMEMYKDQAADRLNDYESALARGDSAAAELYLKEYEAALAAASEAEDEYLSKAEEWAETLKAVLENKLADAAADLEKALTGGSSFDTLSTQMERANSLQEDYLTTTNKIYETNKMINTAQKEIDKTTNTVAKQKLKNFQQETSQLQSRSKLSQYELDIQQAKYDLLLAEIALEEAQQAKSTVRLRRDSEGNFGYVYTADANVIADAEQQVADAQNALYNKGLEGANEYTQKYQQTLQEMYDNLGQIQEQYLNGEFETEEAYHQAMEEAKAFYYQKLQDYSSLYQVALTTDSQVIADAWSTDFADMTYKTEDWKIAVDDYVDQVEIAFGDWNTQIQDIAQDTSLDVLEDNIEDITNESEKLKNTLIGKDGVIDAIESEIDAVKDITSGYATLRGTLSDLMGDYEDLSKSIDDTVRKALEATKAIEQNTNTIYNTTSVGGNGNSGDEVEPNPDPNEEVCLKCGKNKKNCKCGKKITKGLTVYLSADPYGYVKMGHVNALSVDGKRNFTIADLGTETSYGYTFHSEQGSGYIDKSTYEALDAFKTGGYTGSWGTDGKLAMLHQKELILNSDDTSNFLASLEILREIINVIDLHSAHAQLSGLLSSPAYHDYNEPQILEQQVHIEASFPSVTNHSEIEEAFNNLINATSQYINRK